MPIDFQGNSPQRITFGGKSVQRVTYNGTEVWAAHILPEKDSLENMSWADISKVCRAGKAKEYWQLGDVKYLTAAHAVQIIGFDHDLAADPDEYGRERTGLSLLWVNGYAAAAMNGTGNYTATSWYNEEASLRSTLRASALPSLLSSAALAEARPYIAAVTKEYFTVADGMRNTIADMLWLPSYRELFGGAASGFGSEGTQYAFYAAGNSKIKKAANGAACNWWTRSPTGSSAQFYATASSGAAAEYWVSASAVYYAPGFCI